MTIPEIKSVIEQISFPDYTFNITEDSRGAWYLQGMYEEPDTVTGNMELQLTRRWFLNPEMVTSEIVQTVFKCIMTSMEHRAREWFKYKGAPVFGPHFDVEALVAICNAGKFEERK